DNIGGGKAVVSVIIYLPDRKVGLFSAYKLRRDKSGRALRFCRFVALSFRGWARRFRDALYQRLETLRSASALVGVTRQPLKRFFACFGFLHRSLIFPRRCSIASIIVLSVGVVSPTAVFGF